jgi:hypothetical protein
VGREPAGTSDIGVDMGKRGCARTLPNDRFTCTRAFNLCALGTSSSSAIQLSVAFAVKNVCSGILEEVRYRRSPTIFSVIAFVTCMRGRQVKEREL